MKTLSGKPVRRLDQDVAMELMREYLSKSFLAEIDGSVRSGDTSTAMTWFDSFVHLHTLEDFEDVDQMFFAFLYQVDHRPENLIATVMKVFVYEG